MHKMECKKPGESTDALYTVQTTVEARVANSEVDSKKNASASEAS